MLENTRRTYGVLRELPSELVVPELDSKAKDDNTSHRVSNKNVVERLSAVEQLTTSLLALQRAAQSIENDLFRQQTNFQRHIHGGLRSQFL
ncbi:hypothetical protein [Pseudomonas khavaziana]|uniref:hypothetical protein n=1 Tax=Pseudomonas khavaziana TaxID=2842351 RepID=UPI001C3DB513|nr:hypothetical protein [Pseudomonas khavaziana]MBV4482911.1 hypothetical protein [Pseudomonas khavaziana]